MLFEALVPIWEVGRAFPELFVPFLALGFLVLDSAKQPCSFPLGGGLVVQGGFVLSVCFGFCFACFVFTEI